MSKYNLERLTDVELRRKLVEHGLPNSPVTETTRNVLIKKLRTHLNNEKLTRRSPANPTYHNVTVPTPASEDDSDSGINNNIPQRHASASLYSPSTSNFIPPSMSPPAAISKHRNDIFQRHGAENKPTFSGRPSIRPIVDHGVFGGLAMPQPILQQRRTSPTIHIPPPIFSSESEEDSDYSYSTNNGMWRNLSSSPSSLKTTLESKNYSANGNPMTTHNHHFGVVSRLLSLRESTLRKQPQPPCGIGIAPSDEIARQPHRYAPRMGNNVNKYPPKLSRSIFGQFFSRLDFQQGFKQTVIPYALICAFVVFLAAIAFIYMMKSPDLPSSISAANAQFLLCAEFEEIPALNQPAVNCIQSESLPDAIQVLQKLIKLLQERARHHYCVDPSQPEAVNALDFLRYLYETDSSISVRKTLHSLKSAEYLIKRNPQWKVAILTHKDSPNSVEGDHEVDRLLSQQQNHYVLLKPQLPLRCIISNMLHRLLFYIGVSAFISVIGLIGYIAFRMIRGWQNERLMAVEQFTTDIINELLYRASITEVPEEREVTITHLRDKLLPLTKRNSYLWSWNEALRLLEANDSRIQFAETLINGEAHRTMKWTGNVNATDGRADRSCTKKWQSSAFDNADKIVNPPTPCLKIRQMFDSTEVNHPNLKQVIEKAILEKVGPRCKIYDIQLDKQSCCVYMRCASEEDAGIVHNEINGWWFDNRLVSIKFLRLQRYLSRFPNSSTELITHPPTTN